MPTDGATIALLALVALGLGRQVADDPNTSAFAPSPSSDGLTVPERSSALPTLPSVSTDPFAAPPRAIPPRAPGPVARPPIQPVQPQGFQLSDQMMAKLGLKVTKEITEWFLTPSSVPVELSQEAAQAWALYRAGEWADYTSWIDAQLPPIDVGDLTLEGSLAAAETIGELSVAESAATFGEGVEAVSGIGGESFSNLSIALRGLGVAAALVDMGFTIAGDQPDALKAINVALDAAIIVTLVIPGLQIVALVLGIVKAIVGLFGGGLFGGGKSHEQREAEEFAYIAAQGAQPFMRQLADAGSPREMIATMIRWTTGYCGGETTIAIGSNLIEPADPTRWVGIAQNPCYVNAGHGYRDWPDASLMTRDDMALGLVLYGATDLTIGVQAGIEESMKAQLNTAIAGLVSRKVAAWRQLWEHGVTLDQMDALAVEHRKQPRMHSAAHFFGFTSWQDLVGWHVQDYWTRYIVTSREGSLQTFAVAMGYPSWTALRDTVIEPYARWAERITQLQEQVDRIQGPSNGTSVSGPPEAILEQHVLAMERRVRELALAYDTFLQGGPSTVEEWAVVPSYGD